MSVSGSGDGVDDNIAGGDDGCDFHEEQPEIDDGIAQENSDVPEINACIDQVSDGVNIDDGIEQDNSDDVEGDSSSQDTNDIGRVEDDFKPDNSDVEVVDKGYEQDVEGVERENGDGNGTALTVVKSSLSFSKSAEAIFRS